MSLEYPCIYYRGNGLCSYGGDLTDANICVFGPCDNETPSRADLVRRMSDEELAKLLVRRSPCPPSGNNHITCGFAGTCQECWVNWLRQPSEED